MKILQRSKELIDKVLVMQKSGMKLKNIAEELGINVKTLYRLRMCYPEYFPHITKEQRAFILNLREQGISYPMLQILWANKYHSNSPEIKRMKKLVYAERKRLQYHNCSA